MILAIEFGFSEVQEVEVIELESDKRELTNKELLQPHGRLNFVPKDPEADMYDS
jgi:hypothetical protein